MLLETKANISNEKAKPSLDFQRGSGEREREGDHSKLAGNLDEHRTYFFFFLCMASGIVVHTMLETPPPPYFG